MVVLKKKNILFLLKWSGEEGHIRKVIKLWMARDKWLNLVVRVEKTIKNSGARVLEFMFVKKKDQVEGTALNKLTVVIFILICFVISELYRRRLRIVTSQG